MTTPKPRIKRHPVARVEPATGGRARFSSVARRLGGAIRTVGTTAATLVGHVPGTVRATRAGARDTASALQTLPDSTLRSLAATSVGLSAGLRIARAPRIVVAAGAVPALIAGAAIALRPAELAPPTDPAVSGGAATPLADPTD